MILGDKGQLGTALTDLLTNKKLDFIGFDYPEIDLMHPETFVRQIETHKPSVLINCAAYTDVYKAEEDRSTAMQVNALALKDLADICNRLNIYLVHISTDYVFSGNKSAAYVETDTPDPVNFYGISKYAGEMIVRQYAKDYTIVRTAALYGDSKLNSVNIVKKLIELAKNNEMVKLVKNEYTSPTYAGNLAEQLILIIGKKLLGIIHASSEGSCNWVEFGREIYDYIDQKVEIEKVESVYFNKTIKKPKNSELENKILGENKINIMADWKKNIKDYLINEKKQNSTIK